MKLLPKHYKAAECVIVEKKLHFKLLYLKFPLGDPSLLLCAVSGNNFIDIVHLVCFTQWLKKLLLHQCSLQVH